MKKIFSRSLPILVLIATGCTVTHGRYGTNSHFAYPNSNVSPIGQVKATTSKISFIISPSFDDGEIIQLIQDAIAQKSGAEMLLNFSLDTKITVLPLITKTEITIEGTAAKMDVGTQELKEFYDRVQYKAK